MTNVAECRGGWAEVVAPVTAYGNDDLWVNAGTLALVTDQAGQASTVGRYLTVSYAQDRATPLYFTIPGSPTYTFAAGQRQSFAIAPQSDGSVAMRVRYCKE